MIITSLRLRTLQFLADHPKGFLGKGIVHELVPRGIGVRSWSEQGAARMAGKMLNKLEATGYIYSDKHLRMCDRIYYITAAGEAQLTSASSNA